MDTPLSIEGLTVKYGGNTAVNDVSFSVKRGQILGLIGANGAGKSTLIRAVAGLQRAHSGRVRHLGRDITHAPFRSRSRSILSLTFQIPRSAKSLTVEEQLAAQVQGWRHLRSPLRAQPAKSVGSVLADMDLAKESKSIPGQLTLGEVRRFELARSMLNEPALLLVDEPASGMSAAEAVHLANALRSIAVRGVAIVLVEHNIPFIRSVAESVVALDAGQLLIAGETDAVLSSPEVQEAYLGRATS